MFKRYLLSMSHSTSLKNWYLPLISVATGRGLVLFQSLLMISLTWASSAQFIWKILLNFFQDFLLCFYFFIYACPQSLLCYQGF